MSVCTNSLVGPTLHALARPTFIDQCLGVGFSRCEYALLKWELGAQAHPTVKVGGVTIPYCLPAALLSNYLQSLLPACMLLCWLVVWGSCTYIGGASQGVVDLANGITY